ncbi:MAG: hypothetical protein L3J46_03425, partial [Kangiellaceae bacterium]|nr:hypothetical protein [Kangiellaceae bacterium]
MREVLNNVYTESAKHSNRGTNIIFSSDRVYGIEAPVNIYYNRIIALKELKKAVYYLNESGDIVELLNRFPDVGKKESILKYNPFIIYPLYGFLLVLLILVFLYEREYKKRFEVIKNNSLVYILLLFVLMHVVGCLWSDNLDAAV